MYDLLVSVIAHTHTHTDTHKHQRTALQLLVDLEHFVQSSTHTVLNKHKHASEEPCPSKLHAHKTHLPLQLLDNSEHLVQGITFDPASLHLMKPGLWEVRQRQYKVQVS